jgi:2-oxo-4-hydroxy-4-carboxy--5-ureidoimidazoline (OHCU) decarboxylase
MPSAAIQTPPTCANQAEGLSRLDRGSFISVLGDIFEHSPWVVERMAVPPIR